LVWISGIINPHVSKRHLSRANFEIPAHAIEILSKQGCLERVVTIGSVLESIGPVNNYISSKLQLSKFLSSEIEESKFLHVRTHTLVGEVESPPHMFLGQLSRAIRESAPFVMSSGHQTREYIPYSSVGAFLFEQVAGADPSKHVGIKNVGGAQPVKLIDLAEAATAALNPLVSVVTDNALDPIAEVPGRRAENEIKLDNLADSKEKALRFLRVWRDFHPGSSAVFPQLG
jgi:hypothetical protein